MEEAMYGFEDQQIVVPKGIWDRNWISAAADRPEEEKRLLSCQQLLTELLRDLRSSQPANPERMAWMILWARAFTAAEQALACLRGHSEQALFILNRVCFELELQTGVIIGEPLRKDGAGEQVCRNRLRAYTAWCLWSDRLLLKELKRHFNGLSDTTQARRILADEKQRVFHEENFWGGRDVYEDAQDFDGVAFQAWITTQDQEIANLLKSPLLGSWMEHLTQRKPQSFFELINEDERSIRQRLKQMNAAAAYYVYQKGSMAIHGSSALQFLIQTNDASWLPRMIAPNEVDRTASSMAIAGCLEAVRVLLGVAKWHVWEPAQS